jgi:alkanesulfonate monooxygenase SsuD/methylene tetrahydromethanopterin reductase-like flavin-dependent oxidoreductase (luciferase family)
MVGGSGERHTLKIIAKYADACNLFGSAETIKRKLSVLKEHCKSVGRDYNSILKTKLGFVVIDNDREIVEKRIQQIISKVMPEEQVGEFAVYGTPEDVLKQIELLEEVGIQYLIIDLEPNRELEALEIFGDSIIKKMSRTAKAAY